MNNPFHQSIFINSHIHLALLRRQIDLSMAPKFVLVALVSVVVLFVGPTPTNSAAIPPPPPSPMTNANGTNYTAIAIGGEVFCKSCKLPGYVSYLDSSPVKGTIMLSIICDSVIYTD